MCVRERERERERRRRKRETRKGWMWPKHGGRGLFGGYMDGGISLVLFRGKMSKARQKARQSKTRQEKKDKRRSDDMQV